MGKMKPNVFQPDHLGRPTPDKPGPALTRSHSPGRAKEHAAHVVYGAERQFSGGIDPRVGGKPKHDGDLKIHGGMIRQTESGPAFGGDHASAMDSLTGLKTVPGKPGEGAPAHPLTAAAGAKNYASAKPVIGHRSRTAPHESKLGEALLAEAFDASGTDDCMAHGRIKS